MTPALAILAAALPTILPLLAALWEDNPEPIEDVAWGALSGHLSPQVAAVLEPFFRAMWRHFDSLPDAWKWLESRLTAEGVTVADVVPWAQVESDSHAQANAWLARHEAAQTYDVMGVYIDAPITERTPHEPEPLHDPWPAEAETKVER